MTAYELLNEEHPSLSIDFSYDDNVYTLNRIGNHHLVITCLPRGRYDIASAVSVTKDILHSFESIRIELMFDIEEGAPSDQHNIKLGDIRRRVI